MKHIWTLFGRDFKDPSNEEDYAALLGKRTGIPELYVRTDYHFKRYLTKAWERRGDLERAISETMGRKHS